MAEDELYTMGLRNRSLLKERSTDALNSLLKIIKLDARQFINCTFSNSYSYKQHNITLVVQNDNTINVTITRDQWIFDTFKDLNSRSFMYNTQTNLFDEPLVAAKFFETLLNLQN